MHSIDVIVALGSRLRAESISGLFQTILNPSGFHLTKDTRTVNPGFYAVPPQNIFEISPGFQQS